MFFPNSIGLSIHANDLIISKTSQKFLAFPFSIYCPDWINEKMYYKNLKNEDDKVGLKNLVEKIEILIKDKELRERFGENGRQRLIDGDLSIKRRNEILCNLFKD